jgi:hypothetical protein
MSVPRESFPEAATQQYLEGAVVYLQDGYLQECAANPQLIMGVAVGPGKNGATAGAKTNEVELAHPDTLFVGNLDNNGTEGSTVGAATDRGKMYGITKKTSSHWYVDKAKAVVATSRVIVWNIWGDLIPGTTGSATKPAWTDTIPLVVFSFANGFYQGSRTS